jgi:hypothetical protein
MEVAGVVITCLVMFYLQVQVCLYYLVAPRSYLRDCSKYLDLFTVLCIYSNSFIRVIMISA